MFAIDRTWLRAHRNLSDWRTVDVPHDFVLEGTFTEAADMSHGYLPFGAGWYRKTFTVPAMERGKALRIDFEGVMVAATVHEKKQSRAPRLP